MKINLLTPKRRGILKSLLCTIVTCVLIAAQPVAAQWQERRQLSGKVLNEVGDAVVGAVIIDKGTNNASVSGIGGEFTISVPAAGNSVLVVSYMGYSTQEVNVGTQTGVVVNLKQSLMVIDDVVVIGYGSASRKDYTGSVASVKLENSPIAIAPNQNALEQLKGTVPGLNIGASNRAGEEPSVELRGQRSVSGNNTPLVVVDGILFLGDIMDINPLDIATFDILKDATAAAAYGSRSANGVIVITTKKGREAKPTITLNSSRVMSMWQKPPKMMTPQRWIESVQARNGYASDDLTWMQQ